MNKFQIFKIFNELPNLMKPETKQRENIDTNQFPIKW